MFIPANSFSEDMVIHSLRDSTKYYLNEVWSPIESRAERDTNDHIIFSRYQKEAGFDIEWLQTEFINDTLALAVEKTCINDHLGDSGFKNHLLSHIIKSLDFNLFQRTENFIKFALQTFSSATDESLLTKVRTINARLQFKQGRLIYRVSRLKCHKC